MHYTEQLRVLTLGDPRRVEALTSQEELTHSPTAQSVVAAARLGALIALGGSVSSYGSEIDAALAAGLSRPDVVEILLAVTSVVGVPCVVTAAPAIGLALGYDIDEALEQRDIVEDGS